MGQSESEEVSTKLEHETPPLPSTSCQPCLPTPLSAQVQWWCLILFFQQQTLEDRHQEEKEGRILTERRGFSFPQVKAAPAMEGEGGKLLARMSLAQDSLAASLVDNSHTVAAAATTLSPSTTTTTGSIATSRTRASTIRTRVS